MNNDLEAAKSRFNKADTLARTGAWILAGFTVAVLLFVSYQIYSVQNTIAENQKTNTAANAVRLKEYNEDERPTT